MRWMKELWRKARYLGRRGRFDGDLEDEIRFHLEMRAGELEAEGMPKEEARRRARREFGNAARIQEDSRSAWHWQWLEDLLSDLRYAARGLRRNPGFAAAAVLSLALGTGANTTVFSVAMEFLFSRPSCQDPATLVTMEIDGRSHAPMREYRFVRDGHFFPGLAGFREEAETNWRQGSETVRLLPMKVTDNYFEVTGTPVLLGRPLRGGETDAVVLSYRLWQSRMGGRSDVVGRTMVLDGQVRTIAGILPADHRTLVGLNFAPELYLPVTDEAEVVKYAARLPHGLSKASALERLKTAARELDKVFPREGGGSRTGSLRVRGVTGRDRLKSGGLSVFVAFFGMLMAVVGLVLLVACANVASLHLARGLSRRHELSVRLAIGASRSRIVRHLLAESLLLAALGTASGVGLNLLLTRGLNGMALPTPVPIVLQVTPDWRLLWYSVALAAGCALVSGVVPALAAARTDVQSALNQEARQVGTRRWSARDLLVAGELAVTVVLLATSFLFLRNLSKTATMSPGFDTQHTLWATMRLLPDRYESPQKTNAMVDRALGHLRKLPAVESAAVARVVPLNDSVRTGTSYTTDLNAQPVWARIQMNYVGPDYLRTMGIPLVAGREFTPQDRRGATEVVIVNETLARRLFGSTPAVGHTFGWASAGGKNQLLVVGVAKNSKYFTLGEENTCAMYQPYAQMAEARPTFYLLVRAARPPETLVRPITAALNTLDTTAAVEVRPMKSALGLAFLPSRVGAALLGTLGALALLLASVGLYGVLAYTVNRRVREIGLRVALGASPRAVLSLVFRQSFALIGSGAAVGLAVAVFATQPLAMFLVPEVRPSDVVTYAAVAAVLAVVGAAATAHPALRALRVDPTTALRWE
jgi:predicted permease